MRNKYIEKIKSNLDKICEEKKVNGKEVFDWNTFYGIDKIIKKYVGLPEKYSMKGVWPHGIVMDKEKVLRGEKKAELPVVFCYPPYRYEAYKKRTNKKVVKSAHPYLYFLDMEDNFNVERKGTIFFPRHSTDRVTVKMNYKKLARKIKNIEKKYKPVTVCLYWKDYLMGRAKPFIENDITVVSAGHLKDPKFYQRFNRLCLSHKFSAGNEIGSHIFYSVASGCYYFHVTGIDYELHGSGEALRRDVIDANEEIYKRINKVFGSRPIGSKRKQKKEANYFLGNNYKKSPTKLFKDIFISEILDKCKIPGGKKERASHYFPHFWRRTIVPKIANIKNHVLDKK